MSNGENTEGNKYIICPHCRMDFRCRDIEPTLDKGHFKCHVCGKKFPSPLPEHQYTPEPVRPGRYRALIYAVLAVVIVFAGVYFFTSASKIAPVSAHFSSPGPAPAPVAEGKAPATTLSASEKLQTIERIAADFHKNHTYTMEGEFVCVDMAISVWNQLVTNGIEAKIMGGNIKEDITDWNYRQLVTKSDHAWVVAQISPSEKVAIETTAGLVIKPDMKNAAPYFRGIAFDNPAQIKKFEFQKRRANEVCQEARQLIDDWNNNIAGKQYRSDANTTRQSKIEQRKLDCDNAALKLEEFRSRTVFN